jgi:protease I
MVKEKKKNKEVAMIIAFRDFRDEEYFLPKEILEKEGIEVKTVSNKEGIALGSEGGEAKVDILLKNLKVEDFDAFVFIGGRGCLKNLDNELSFEIARLAFRKEKILAAICIAPVILAKAKILEGKKMTVWNSPLDKRAVEILTKEGVKYSEKEIVIDGRIITASGPQVAKEFGEAIVKILNRT